MNIDIKDLDMIYPNGHKALTNVDLSIGDGMFGLLGANGAGKSTLMKILVTHLKQSSGSITINGVDLQKHRKQVRQWLGYLPQDFRFFSSFKTWEFLDYSARLSGMKGKSQRRDSVEEMLEKVGLYEFRERRASKLSGGMKRRLGIAQALIGDPKIIIVDEPTTGLDPDERIRFRNLLSDLSHKDVTIILSTHIIGDISSVCNNMALLNRGEVVFKGTPDGFIKQANGKVWQSTIAELELDQLKLKYPVVSTIPVDNGWEVQYVAEECGGYKGINVEPNLEHAYVYFMDYVLNEERIV